MTAHRNNVSLSLNDQDFERLQAWAESHDWTKAHAARVIIHLALERIRDQHPNGAPAPATAPARRAPDWP